MVNVLESTLEWTQGEAIFNSGKGSYTPCFSLDSASVTDGTYEDDPCPRTFARGHIGRGRIDITSYELIAFLSYHLYSLYIVFVQCIAY
jgi:hypothetical protein